MSTVLWACVSLEYSLPPYMLQQFIQSHSNSHKPVVTQGDTMILWGLAVLGGLTMDYFQKIVKRLPKTLADDCCLQLYTALQALRPQDTRSSGHQDWLQVGSAFLLLPIYCLGLCTRCVQASVYILYPFSDTYEAHVSVCACMHACVWFVCMLSSGGSCVSDNACATFGYSQATYLRL